MKNRAVRAARTLAPYALLVFFVAVHVVLVGEVVQDRGALEHDEIISQLEATGHLDDWMRAIAGDRPTGSWVSGAEVRRFLEVDGGTSPGAVHANVSDLDIHPPLYFWMLSGVRSLGVGIIWSGPVLSIVLVLLAALVLFALLVEALRSPLLASLAIGVFLIPQALIRATAYTRPYPLLMLEVVILIWMVVRLLRRPNSPLLFGGLFVIGTLGFLTSPTFAFPFAGALLTLGVWWIRGSLRSVAYAAAAALGSVVTAVIIHPAFYEQYRKSNEQNAVDPPVAVVTRARLWFKGFGDFVARELVDKPGLVVQVLAIVVVTALLVTAPWWVGPSWSALRRRPVIAAAFGVTGFAVFAATVAYVLGRVPLHAAGWEYIIAFWPGIVLLGAIAVRRTPYPAVALAVIIIVIGTYTWRWKEENQTVFHAQRVAVEELSHATLVVADCMMRGYTPGALMWVPRDAKVLLPSRGGAIPPPIPDDADLSRAFLLHVDVCSAGVRDLDALLWSLSLERGTRVGPIGYVELDRLVPRK